jgi:ligand-binding sensor domain-containing protein
VKPTWLAITLALGLAGAAMAQPPRDPLLEVQISDFVRRIHQDHRGDMWFGTPGGVFVWDGTKLENISTADGLCGDAVNDILEARDGSFWFATHHNGVCRLKDGKFTHFGTADGVQGDEAWDLFIDGAGNIWFPTEHFGVYRYDGNGFVNLTEMLPWP